jgi:capsular exopolysaccharide synthesis family protein
VTVTPNDPLPELPAPLQLPQSGSSNDSPNLLRYYVGVVRRRWKWIVIGLVVGLLAGYASTLMDSSVKDPVSYYKATNTMVASGASVNLQQAAFLLESADLLNRVSNDTGISVDVLSQRISAIARGDVMAIDVTAISTDPNQAVQLADTTAKALIDFTQTDQQRQFSVHRDEVIAKLDALKAQRTDLETKIAQDPAHADLMKAELDSVVNQYRLVYEEFQALATTGIPTGGLSTIQPASPIQINGGAYAKRIDANTNARGQISSGVATTGPSETNLSSKAPVSRTTRVLIGGVAGLVLGIVTAFVVEAWDDRLRRRDRVEQITGLPVIAELPTLSRAERTSSTIAIIDAPRSRAAERFRSIRTALLFVFNGPELDLGNQGDEDAGPRQTPTVMVTSPSPGEGKTTTSANLAAVFGDSGMRTLVVDCDYRKPSVAKLLSPVPDPDDSTRPYSTRHDNVWFVPSPTYLTNPAEVILELRRLIARWRNEFDVVVLDTPPMLTTNDAVDLLAAADSVLLVLRAGQTRTTPAERVANLLARYQANVLGIVLNSCNPAEMDQYYGYYYYYGGSGARGYYGAPTPDPQPENDKPFDAPASP